jgi:hypothetical protein
VQKHTRRDDCWVIIDVSGAGRGGTFRGVTQPSTSLRFLGYVGNGGPGEYSAPAVTAVLLLTRALGMTGG